MGEVRSQFMERRLERREAPSEMVTSRVLHENVRAIQSVDSSIQGVGAAVELLAKETKQGVQAVVTQGARSIEQSTKEMHTAVEKTGEEAEERSESFLMQFGRRIKGVFPKDTAGILSAFGLGGVTEGMADLKAALTVATPLVKGLGKAAAVAGAAYVGFETGQWLYGKLFPGGEKWVDRQWEIIFGDIRREGVAGAKKTFGDIWQTLSGAAADAVKKGAEPLEEYRKKYAATLEKAQAEAQKKGIGLTGAEMKRFAAGLPTQVKGTIEALAPEMRVQATVALMELYKRVPEVFEKGTAEKVFKATGLFGGTVRELEEVREKAISSRLEPFAQASERRVQEVRALAIERASLQGAEIGLQVDRLMQDVMAKATEEKITLRSALELLLIEMQKNTEVNKQLLVVQEAGVGAMPVRMVTESSDVTAEPNEGRE